MKEYGANNGIIVTIPSPTATTCLYGCYYIKTAREIIYETVEELLNEMIDLSLYSGIKWIKLKISSANQSN
ncbi:unnamed protein product [Onchocerca flexuosa]|uniref:DUF3343 domain-containing protein n=1 Tax=Onchocerca flexuosa TaxID=387005 RepID=A0A183HKX6_9BILA|nr:unnamed protein product [Onchocerca flexuosa]